LFPFPTYATTVPGLGINFTIASPIRPPAFSNNSTATNPARNATISISRIS
jgi:hypothetical protein